MNVFVIGASGHAKVLIDAARAEGKFQIAGVIDSRVAKGQSILGFPVVGVDADIASLQSDNPDFNVIVGIGDNDVRAQVVARLDSIRPRLQFVVVRHPAAIVAEDVQLGRGTAILAGAIVSSSCVVGDFCILNTNSSLDHDCDIGHFTSLGPASVIGGGCRIGSNTAIGIGAVVKHGVEIGDNVVVGAGSLVLHNIGSNVVAYGSPAQVVRSRAPGDRYL